jgi:phosphate transport system substrate-binding protein
VSLGEKADAEAYAPTYENVLSRKYPLARYLYVYIINDPNKPLDPLVREFMKFVLSREGQEIVIKDGYLPIPAKVAQEELAKLD